MAASKTTYMRFFVGSLLMSFGLVIINPDVHLITQSPLIQSFVGMILFIIGIMVLLFEFAEYIIRSVDDAAIERHQGISNALNLTATQMQLFKRELPPSTLSNKEKRKVAKYLDAILSEVTEGDVKGQWITSFMDEDLSTMVFEARAGARMKMHGYEETKRTYVIYGRIRQTFRENTVEDETLESGDVSVLDSGVKHEIHFEENSLIMIVLVPPVEIGSVIYPPDHKKNT